MKRPPCHAGAEHGPASYYSNSGWLCDACWCCRAERSRLASNLRARSCVEPVEIGDVLRAIADEMEVKP